MIRFACFKRNISIEQLKLLDALLRSRLRFTSLRIFKRKCRNSACMKNERIENWLIEAADLMARSGCSLVEAAGLLDQPVESDQIDVIVRRKSFLKLLWEARHRYFSTLGKDPNFTQDVVIGRLLGQAQKLEDEGQNDKAAEVLLKIAKIRGWVGPDNQISVFGELSQADLDSIRRKIEDSARTAPRPN